MDDAIFAVMTVPAPIVSPAKAVAVARDLWGITADARLLTGERDANFHLRASDGREYVLKFANAAENAAVVEMQIRALAHVVARDPGLLVPRMVPQTDGAIETILDGVRVRLLSWVAGIPLHAAPRSAAQRRACGVALARLGLALADFSHPASATPLIWDLTHAPRLRDVVHHLEPAYARAPVLALLDAYDREVAPLRAGMRSQVLYNDMNIGNILVDPTNPDHVVGIIDFGDLVHTALAIDAAVGATAQLVPTESAAQAMADFIAGFHATRPLLADEMKLLPLLTACRLAMSLVLQSWHRATHPDNPHYRTLSETDMNARLALIADVQAPDTHAAVRRACGMA